MRIRACSVILTGVGNHRVRVMAAIRQIRCELSLREVKVLTETLPQIILHDVDADAADDAPALLHSAGAETRTEKPHLSTNIQDWLVSRTTIEKIKAEATATEQEDSPICGEAAGLSRLWQDLERFMQRGDELWTFSSPRIFWENLCGRGGYAIVREGNVVKTVLTVMN